MTPRSTHRAAALAIGALLLLAASDRSPPPAVAQSGFLETFDGQPGAAAPWQPADWAVDANNADMWSSDGLHIDQMTAVHSAACGAPPATHLISTTADAVYPCNDHIMTAMSAGYGAVFLTPPAMLDMRNGEAVLRFDVSTFRTTGRDWIDLWVTPFADQFALPLNIWLPPYQGEPRRAVQIKMEGASRFLANRYDPAHRSDTAGLPSASSQPYESVLTPSQAIRTTFELRLSKTHVKFGLPVQNLWWVDTAINPPLDWDTGVIQLAQHAYNPTKDCPLPVAQCPNTWHWDTVSVAPSLPLSIVPTTPRWAVAKKGGPDTLTLARPAPANASLRFAAVGANLELSFNGGQTWAPAMRQPTDRHAPEHFSPYLSPIPAGATSVKIRGTGDSYVGTWMVANANVMAAGAAQAVPTNTPTLPPTATATSTATAMPTGTATATATNTPIPATVTPTTVPQICVAHLFWNGADTGLQMTVPAAQCGH